MFVILKDKMDELPLARMPLFLGQLDDCIANDIPQPVEPDVVSKKRGRPAGAPNKKGR